MSTNLESNIILNTQLTQPKGKGFESLHNQLQKIERKLERLTQRDWQIKVRLDDSGLSSANLKIVDQIKGATKAAKDAMREMQGAQESLKPPSSSAGPVTKYGTNRKVTKDGIVETSRRTEEGASGGFITTRKTKYDSSGNIKEIDENLVDIAAKKEADKQKEQEKWYGKMRTNSQKLAEQINSKEVDLRLKSRQEEEDAAKKNYMTNLKFNSRLMEEQMNQEAAKEKSAESDAQKKYKNALKFNSQILADQQRQQEAEAAASDQTTRKNYTTKLKFNSQVMEEQRRLAESDAAAIEAAEKKKFMTKLKFNSRVLEFQQNMADSLAKKQSASDAKELASTEKKYMTNLKFNSRVMADQDKDRQASEKKDEISRRRTYSKNLRFNSRVMAEQENAASAQSNRETVAHAVNELPGRGFTRRPSSHSFNTKTGQLEETQKFQRVTGSIFRGYQVEVINANTATGKFTSQVLEGAQASRALGDSMQHAIAKVAMWSVATGAVFATVQAIRAATSAAIELEQSTVLLARVGRGLNGNFEERLATAKRLSRGIVELTAVYGGNSEAAVKAAAVFARAGQNEMQILESVRASLLASRIAELDVVEAAELMSSAIYQFGGDVSQMIPTIDMLNTLSNQYRVTTDDLLQSISRSGSIIAQQNGRMSELAAVTAVTASVTSRSGAEIGNAIKTIASQVDRVETKRYLLEKLGITVHDVGGESKSYTRFLLDMSLALDTATDAERNLATTQVAGVRQRNVLLAQMKNVVEAIKAENKALIGTEEDRKYGSAGTEFQQTSTTMEATLQRLRAQSILATSELGEGFLELGKDMSDILTGMLKYISSGNEATNGMLSQIAVITALTVALRMLSNAYGINIESILRFIDGIDDCVSKTGTASASVRELSMQFIRSAGAAIVSIGAMAAVALAITVIIDVTAQYARQIQLAKEIEQSRNQVLEREITTQRNRATAYRKSTEHIVAMRLAIEKLKKEEARTGVDRTAEKNNIERGIKEISREAGLPYSSTDTAEDVAAAGQQKEIEASRQEASLRQKRLENLRMEQAKRNREMEFEEKAAKQGEDILESWQASGDNRASAGAYLGEDRPELTKRVYGQDAAGNNKLDVFTRTKRGIAFDLGGELSVKTQIMESVAALQKLRAESASSSEEIAKLVKQIEELNNVQAVLVAQEREVTEWKRTLADFAKTADQSSQYRAASTESNSLFGSEESQVRSQYDEVKKELEGVYDAYVKLRDARVIDAEQAQDTERKLIAGLEEEKKLYLQLKQIRTSAMRSENQTITNDDSKMRQASVRIALERQRGLSSGNSSMLDSTASIEINRRALIEDNNALFKEQEQIAKGGGTSEQKAVALESIKLKIAENLVQLRSLESDKALSILEAEKNIAIERKKSADEALRALGVLTREDKARVMAQAAYFNKNPGKKISAEQQFLMGADDNRIGRQFFDANYENLGDSNSDMARFLNRAGFGMTQEITRGQRELGRFQNGRTPQQIAEDARANQLAIGQQQARLRGGEAGDAQMQANQFRAGMQGVLANVVAPQLKDIHIQHKFDFSGVSEQLQRVYQLEAATAASQVAQELKLYVDRKLALSKLPPPRVANPQ